MKDGDDDDSNVKVFNNLAIHRGVLSGTGAYSWISCPIIRPWAYFWCKKSISGCGISNT